MAGSERLADMETRVAFLLQDDHAVALLGEQDRCGGAGGAAADHDDVAFLRFMGVAMILAQCFFRLWEPEHCNVEFLMHDNRPANRPDAHAPIGSLPHYWSDEASRRKFVDRLFDGTAGEYDFVERLLGLGRGPSYRRDALRRAGLVPGMRVLDIATGTGLVAREAIGLVGPKGSVIGLDPSVGMLEEARELRIPLVRALGERLPFPDDTFDFLSMGFALRHVSNLETLLAEVRRVIRPAGTACILELTRPQGAIRRRFDEGLHDSRGSRLRPSRGARGRRRPDALLLGYDRRLRRARARARRASRPRASPIRAASSPSACSPNTSPANKWGQTPIERNSAMKS